MLACSAKNQKSVRGAIRNPRARPARRYTFPYGSGSSGTKTPFHLISLYIHAHASVTYTTECQHDPRRMERCVRVALRDARPGSAGRHYDAVCSGRQANYAQGAVLDFLEHASDIYTTEVIANIIREESNDGFELCFAMLGLIQQSGTMMLCVLAVRPNTPEGLFLTFGTRLGYTHHRGDCQHDPRRIKRWIRVVFRDLRPHPAERHYDAVCSGRQANYARGAVLNFLEHASHTYTTEVIANMIREESKGRFEARFAIPGHVQQGGAPSPMDRGRAVRLAVKCIVSRTVCGGERGGDNGRCDEHGRHRDKGGKCGFWSNGPFRERGESAASLGVLAPG